MQQYEGIHFEAQRDAVARLAVVADIVQLAFVIALDAREQVEIGSHVSAAKPILGEFDQEGVEAGACPAGVGAAGYRQRCRASQGHHA